MQHLAVSGALGIVCLVTAAPLTVEAATWCHFAANGGVNCGYSSQQQCLNGASGVGGSCRPGANSASDDRSAPSKRVERENRKKNQKQASPSREQTSPQKPASIAPAAVPVQQPATAAAPSQPAAAVAPPSPRAGGSAATPAAAQSAFAAARNLILAGQYQAGLTAMQALGFDDHPDVATYIGLAQSRLGRVAEARAAYEKALAADPNHLLTLSYYGMLRAEQGDLRNAQADLEKIRRLCGGPTCKEYIALDGVIASKRR